MLRHNKAIHIGFLLATVFFVAGCAPSAPLAVSLALKVPMVPLNIGAGTKVYPSVLDQRPDKILGYRAKDFRWQGMGKPLRDVHQGPISVSEDVGTVILKSLKDGLSSLGFETLVTAEPSAPTLEVTAQSLRYEVIGKLAPYEVIGKPGWSCCINVANFSGTFTVKTYKDTTLLYAMRYDNSREQTYNHFRASDSNWFEENFNAVVSDLMGQLLTDVRIAQSTEGVNEARNARHTYEGEVTSMRYLALALSFLMAFSGCSTFSYSGRPVTVPKIETIALPVARHSASLEAKATG